MNQTNKKIIISGIQPTNNLTLGNYLGSIQRFKQYQDDYELIVFVADLHAITTSEYSNLKQNKNKIIKTFIASGIDLNKVKIYIQSEVSDVCLLNHILLCHTTIGELNRMTQFKDKSQKCTNANQTQFIPTGLLVYPILMAADILMWDANLVLVGKDQKQHLELTKNIALRINNKFKKEIFSIPEPMISSSGSKIMDLVNPLIKMSKSNKNTKGTIFLNDELNVINKKIMSALTDNLNQVKYDVVNQPGISNLIEIYKNISGLSIKEIELKYQNIENYGVFKKDVALAVVDLISDLQKKAHQISQDQIDKLILDHKNKLRQQADTKIKAVLKRMEI